MEKLKALPGIAHTWFGYIQALPWRAILAMILVIFAILSITVLRPCLSTPETYRDTLEVLDNQKVQAAGLTATVTAVSAAISLLPDDTGSSLADELDDLAMPLFLISCMLVLEKFMLTTFGFIAATFLIPAACVLLAIFLIWPQEQLLSWFKRLLVLALALTLLVPASAGITALVEETHADSVNSTYDAISELWGQVTAGSDSGNAFVDFFKSVANGATALLDTVKEMLGLMIDAIAVLLITTCAIPLITFFVFYKASGFALRANIPVQQITSMAMTMQRKRREQRKARRSRKQSTPATVPSTPKEP